MSDMEFKIRVEEKKKKNELKPFTTETYPDAQNSINKKTISAKNNKKKIQIEKSMYENRDKLVEMFKTGK
jgi:hypothetical protein